MVWKQGLFGCFGNIGLSVVSCCVFPLSVAKNAVAVGEEHPLAWVFAIGGAPCVAGALLRGMVRKQKGIDGDFWTDALIWLCCPCCAICQETAEVGSMDYLVTPELQTMGRSANDAVGTPAT